LILQSNIKKIQKKNNLKNVSETINDILNRPISAENEYTQLITKLKKRIL